MLRSKFPVGECIEDCRLVDLGTIKKDKDTIIFFKFKQGNSILVAKEYNPRLSVLGDKYHDEKLRINKFLESIFLTYLEPSEIVAISKKSTSLDDYLANIKEAIAQKDGFSIPIDLKTVPDMRGEARLPKYITYGNKFFPFIRKSNDNLKELIYSKSEQKLWDLNKDNRQVKIS